MGQMTWRVERTDSKNDVHRTVIMHDEREARRVFDNWKSKMETYGDQEVRLIRLVTEKTVHAKAVNRTYVPTVTSDERSLRSE